MIHYSFYFEYIQYSHWIFGWFHLSVGAHSHFCSIHLLQESLKLILSLSLCVVCRLTTANTKSECELQWSLVHSPIVAYAVNMHPNFLDSKYAVLFILANSLLLNSCIIPLFITHLFKRFIAHIKRGLLYFAHLNFVNEKWNDFEI